jgi:hypothetical protein
MSLKRCICYEGSACNRSCGPAKRGLFSATAIAASTRSKPSPGELTPAQVKRVTAAATAVERKHLASVKAADEQEADAHAAIMAGFGLSVGERVPAGGPDVHKQIMASFGIAS